MLALMVEAPFLLVRAALPHMYRQEFGRIVDISSVPGPAAGFSREIADQAPTHGMPGEQVVSEILLKEVAIKRLAEPEEVAALAGWPASSDAGTVTGVSYTMDGGWSAR